MQIEELIRKDRLFFANLLQLDIAEAKEGGLMDSGDSGRYYTSHGSHRVHHGALIHSFDGRFTRNPRTGKIQNLKSGGHGQSTMDVMDRNGIKYNIVKTFPN
ncbi:MAG: hypothetical protein RR824_07040 [Clostridia bacterium]